MTTENSACEDAAQLIAKDIQDRSGLDNEWHLIDEETRNEIIHTWAKIIRHEVMRTL